jgi:DNA-binding transcriptional ArsR family regulator
VDDTPDISAVAALLGDPARARMLTALMDDRAHTASELAHEARVAPSTASGHLGKLAAAGLVVVDKQGRHRYFRLAGREVAKVLEGLMGLAARTAPARVASGPRSPALREARVCYDDLAGSRGVRMLDSLRESGFIAKSGGALQVTAAGESFLRSFGVDFEAFGRSRRPLCLPCLDWSERRSHLGGALGAALLRRLYAQGWARRERRGRAVVFTPEGLRAFTRVFP